MTDTTTTSPMTTTVAPDTTTVPLGIELPPQRSDFGPATLPGPVLDPWKLLYETQQAHIAFLQERIRDLEARLTELASPGANARLAWRPPDPVAQGERPGRDEPSAGPPRTFNAALLAALRADCRKDEEPQEDATTRAALAATHHAQIEKSFRIGGDEPEAEKAAE